MEALETIALSLGAAWGSGINLYATVLVLGLLDGLGLVSLPPGLEILSSPWVLGAAILLYLVEFFADKVPGLDSLWDILHTFIRIPAGALLAAGAAQGVQAGLGPEVNTALALLAGGAVAAGSHFIKAGSRAMVNVSPEPVSNILVSLFEDVMVFVGVAVAVLLPVAFVIAFGLLLLLAIWILPMIWRGLRRFIGLLRHPCQAGGRQRFSCLPGYPRDAPFEP